MIFFVNKSGFLVTCLITTILVVKIEKAHSQIHINNDPITKLPFGSSLLVKHKFPKEGWDIPVDDTVVSKPININTQALTEIGDFYIKMGSGKSIAAPTIKHLNYLIMGDDSQLIPYERKFKADFKCRLPNVGPYECYYQYYQVPMSYYYEIEAKSDGSNKLYLEYGNLVFYNPQTGQAKILNVYNSYSYKEPTGGGNRYFFIDVNNEITVYYAWEGESHDIIRKTQEVKIQNDGQIIIRNIK